MSRSALWNEEPVWEYATRAAAGGAEIAGIATDLGRAGWELIAVDAGQGTFRRRSPLPRFARWRDERVERIALGDTPWTLEAGPRAVLHLAPMSAFVRTGAPAGRGNGVYRGWS
jgi:hypothetical protein